MTYYRHASASFHTLELRYGVNTPATASFLPVSLELYVFSPFTKEEGKSDGTSEHIISANCSTPPEALFSQTWLSDTLQESSEMLPLQPGGAKRRDTPLLYLTIGKGPTSPPHTHLSPGKVNRLLLPPPPPSSEIIYSITGLPATSHYTARTVSHWKG